MKNTGEMEDQKTFKERNLATAQKTMESLLAEKRKRERDLDLLRISEPKLLKELTNLKENISRMHRDMQVSYSIVICDVFVYAYISSFSLYLYFILYVSSPIHFLSVYYSILSLLLPCPFTYSLPIPYPFYALPSPSSFSVPSPIPNPLHYLLSPYLSLLPVPAPIIHHLSFLPSSPPYLFPFPIPLGFPRHRGYEESLRSH
jgi:hypothetical protein